MLIKTKSQFLLVGFLINLRTNPKLKSIKNNLFDIQFYYVIVHN